MSLDHRFARYAALAAVPAAVTGAAHAQLDPNTNWGNVDTTDIVVNRGSLHAIGSIIGMQFSVSFTTSSVRFNVKNARLGGQGNYTVNWWLETSQKTQLDLWGPGADINLTNSATISATADGPHFIGFAGLNTSFQIGAAWIQYEIDPSFQFMTILSWSTANHTIYMPAAGTNVEGSNSGGGGAVPGIGGLAALACGAAGVRRNRQRVA